MKVECECCGYKISSKTHMVHMEHRGRVYEFCNLCVSSGGATSVLYPDKFQGQAKMVQAIHYIGNAVLDFLQSMSKGPVESEVYPMPIKPRTGSLNEPVAGVRYNKDGSIRKKMGRKSKAELQALAEQQMKKEA